MTVIFIISLAVGFNVGLRDMWAGVITFFTILIVLSFASYVGGQHASRTRLRNIDS